MVIPNPTDSKETPSQPLPSRPLSAFGQLLEDPLTPGNGEVGRIRPYTAGPHGREEEPNTPCTRASGV